MDIKNLTIISALEDLRSKKITAVDLVEACLENIRKHNQDYNVLLTVEDDDKLIKQAREADATDHSSPLSGIPIVVKDMFSTKNLRTTAASKVLENYTPKYESTVTRKLKEAGAIIIGKANQDAWAHGATGENSDFEPTRNAIGTDTGGSIRVPASYNNLVGLKPTYGRVSRYGVVAMASSLDTMAHVTKNVTDSAHILNITAGADPYDATSIKTDPEDYLKSLTREDLKGVKIGLSPDFKMATLDKKLVKKIDESLKLFEKLGGKIIEVPLPHTPESVETYYILVPSEISSNLARYDGIRYGNGRSHFGAEAKRRIMIGTYSLSSGYYDAYYKAAQKVRTLIIKDFTSAFEHVDVIFAPVAPVLPYKIGEKVNDPLTLYLMDIYTSPVNLSGLPSLALPAGFVDDLPVGIQIIGPPLSESRLFSIGNAYEKQ
ncbi:MAG: Glutamyl-tRNA(Gln) amidotransferase subunit A [Microgenomates group bacterium GW2011_GWA1_48_10]|nr:MAG: Glutamyl-tRNA(Gln) amidotransferase subunit A [Microgenomates group bacterium GW2011_GWA1_48_10]